MTVDDAPSMDDELIVDVREATLEITLNRPQRLNALTPRMYLALADAWARFRDDDRIRVAILTGSGSRAFTAGADLRLTVPLLTGARQPADTWDEQFLSDLSVMNAALLRDFTVHKPIIAAVNGPAIGAGTEMLQATDLRIASRDATFALPEVRQGIIPGGGSITRLARQIPWAIASEIVLTGRPIDAERALAVGLVNEVVDPGDVVDRAREWAADIECCAPLAVQAAKQGMLDTSGMPLEAGLRLERRLVARIMETDDAREGPRAFAEKRPPRFSGAIADREVS